MSEQAFFPQRSGSRPFATRVPVFMYLTDYREYSLQDVITQLEPELFKKVTGLDVKDFELLVSLNVFNESLMNDAVYKFKRYEDASLVYTGIDQHSDENVGLYSTVISREDYDAMAGQGAGSKKADAPDDDMPERPSFTNISNDSYADDDGNPRKRTSIAQPSKPATGGVYRPAFVPPAPEAPTPKKPVKKAEFNAGDVHAGTIVRHKAFGLGKVKGIEGSRIVISFQGQDKQFQNSRKFPFPGAFEQGFLSLEE